MLTLSILVGALAASGDLEARVEVLEFHLDRLHAITVPEALEAEKQARVEALAASLGKGAKTPEEVNALYLRMDEVRQWLWTNAAERPTLSEGAFEESDDAWILKNAVLTVSVNKQDLAIAVTTPATVWQFAPCDDRDIELGRGRLGLLAAGERRAEPLRTAYSTGLLVSLKKYPEAPEQHFILGIHLTQNEVRFSLTAPCDVLEFRSIQWPKPLEIGNRADDLSVIPCMQGMIVPGNWEQKIRQRDLCNSRTLYMPWWGQIHEGHGVLTILESSDDAGVAYDHRGTRGTRIEALSYASMRKLRYPRWIRCVFDDAATHVTFAKRYRRYVQEAGRFVSLAEKRVRTPRLDAVIGRPVVHLGALYHNVEESHYYNKERLEANHALQTFESLAGQLRGLKAKGIGEAYVHLDGWGFFGYDNGHPDPLPPGEEQGGWDGLRRFADTCDELGWVFATHDQYRDFYFTSVSFDDRLVALHADGGREEHSTWCGGPQTILSAVFAPGYVRRNHDLFSEHGIKVRGAYLDVFAIVPLEESYAPAHPMTRTDCAAYRAQCFNLLRARGYVVSSEEPVDRFVPVLDLVHHGPYSFFSEEGYVGIPVPLFNLVYHDSILLPWSTEDDGGWGIPKGDAGWNHCLLNAGMPYVTPGADAARIERVQMASELARRCSTLEMTNHEFLDGSFRKQRTTFSDGTRVTVDFASKECSIE